MLGGHRGLGRQGAQAVPGEGHPGVQRCERHRLYRSAVNNILSAEATVKDRPELRQGSGEAVLSSITRNTAVEFHLTGGSPVPDGRPLVISVEAGSSHCGWQHVVFLAMAWPLHRPVRGPFMSDARTHVYVWQPDHAYPSSSLATTPRVVERMPSDARYTGLHRGPWQLWVSPSRIEFAVFLKSDQTIQRWPFVSKFVGCA